MSRSYTSSPPKRLHGVERDCFTFTLLTKEWKGEKIKINKKEKSIQNKIQDFKNAFFPQKQKFPYKPTCEVGSV
jgi:hypothetical protein